VLGLVLTGEAYAAYSADESLILYLPLDEGQGSIVTDASSFKNEGEIVGAAAWVEGNIGMALEIVDGSHVLIPEIPEYDVTSAITLMTWMRTTTVTTWARLIDKSQWQSNGFDLVLNLDTHVPAFEFFVNNTTSQVMATTPVDDGEWHFVAGTFGNQTLRIYVDGIQEGEVQSVGGVDINPNDWPIMVGAESSSGGGQQYVGAVDEVAVFARELTAEEILDIFENGMASPGLASRPQPQDEAVDVPLDVVLGWTPGEFAPPVNGHKVYFSESFDDVNDGVGGITQDANSYAQPQRLDFGTIYYWRVDEVNAPPTSHIEFKGEVWQFTTEPFAYAIENITATASSTHQADTGPENTINGSGLDADDLHSIETAGMWLSGDEPNGAWIEYELGKVYKLHEMWVWNANQMMESFIGFGIKDVTVEYSTNGTEYTTLGTTHEFVRAPGAAGYAYNTTVDFGGAAAKYVRLTANSNWGGLMPQYGLSEVRFFYIPVLAREPSPDSGTTDVAVDVTLGFRAGREAAEHGVYLSTDEQAVIDGTAPVTTVTENSFGPLSLDLGKTYYWRVDEVNETETPTTWQGEIWNFTTPEFFIVEDFEDYNDYPPDEIWSTWVDGYGVPENGATVGYPAPDWNRDEHYVETATVHGGEQAMPFFYDNTGAAIYSEGKRTFAVPQDWTKAGVQTLVLWFQGDPNNALTEQMYVKVNNVKVVYDGDTNNIVRRRWTQWNIDLTSLGISLSNVTSLSIGFERTGAFGDTGMVLIDDIRLYRVAAPIPEPADPGSTGLVAYYALDNNAEDGSGNGNHGTLQGTPQWVEGLIGEALQFNGSTDYVEVADAPGLDITNTITIAVWVKANTFGDWRGFVTKGLETAPYAMQMWGDGSLRFGWNWDSPAGAVGDGLRNSNAKIPLGEWAHLAVTYDGSTLRFYINGGLDTREVDVSLVFGTNDEPLTLGCDFPGGDEYFDGAMDDVRIYDRALLPGEVMFLGDLIP